MDASDREFFNKSSAAVRAVVAYLKDGAQGGMGRPENWSLSPNVNLSAHQYQQPAVLWVLLQGQAIRPRTFGGSRPPLWPYHKHLLSLVGGEGL
jgi:hypothetical protein